MGNKSKRPGLGPTSELVATAATSAPAMLAAMVHDAGGAVSIGYDVLAKVADELLLNVTTTPEGVQLTTTLKPIIRPQLEVPEGPAGIADLGQPAQDARPTDADDWGTQEPPDGLEEYVAIQDGIIIEPPDPED